MSNLLIAPGTASKFKRQGAGKDYSLYVLYSSTMQDIARAGGGNMGSGQDCLHVAELGGLLPE